jgi:hypothetical protein
MGILGMETFARLRSWHLGEVAVDDDPARPLLAWSSLVALAREQTLVAVLIPDVEGLRPPPPMMEQLQTRCVREIGAPLLLATTTVPGRHAHPAPWPPSSPPSGLGVERWAW